MIEKTPLRRVTSQLGIVVAFAAAVLCIPTPGFATPVLGSALAKFAVLGATASVTNIGATTLTGDVGVGPALSITGLNTITVNGTNGATGGNPFVHLGDATAISAQQQLTDAITSLGLMGSGTLEPANLAGLTLYPGVYTVPAGTSNLTGTLILDGLGNANAAWVFQMESDLITSSGSVVNVINTGAGAGVFWDVRSSATLGTTTSFQGNILALTSITLATGAKIGCGRALANTGAVTMDSNTINSIAYTGTGEEWCSGLGGGLTVTTPGAGGTEGTPTPLPFAPIPEPGTLLLLGTGIAGLVARTRQSARG